MTAPMSRILVGDDQPMLVEACQLVLESAGHTVQSVTDGQQAVTLARQWHPDLVVLDWLMPNLDGLGALAALRATPDTADIPILMMSGSPGAEARALQDGADLFLAKPFDADDLLATVAKALESHGPRPPRMNSPASPP